MLACRCIFGRSGLPSYRSAQGGFRLGRLKNGGSAGNGTTLWEEKMKPIAKVICCIAILPWISDATAGGVTVRESAGTVILESTSDMNMPASAVPVIQRAPASVHYDNVDRARAEKRLESNALRARKRTAEAQKDAAERAAKARLEQKPPAR